MSGAFCPKYPKCQRFSDKPQLPSCEKADCPGASQLHKLFTTPAIWTQERFEYVEAHFDTGGKASESNIVELFEQVKLLRQSNAALVQALEDAKAERNRAFRNRDMWKGQAELQAETIASMRKALEEAKERLIDAVNFIATSYGPLDHMHVKERWTSEYAFNIWETHTKKIASLNAALSPTEPARRG